MPQAVFEQKALLFPLIDSIVIVRIGDGTHHKKRHAVRTKGESPIEKNVAVTDEQGNTYQPTYLRRAKGLVKHGRARWMDDNHICLTCPPEQITEISEDDMSENQVSYIKEQIEFLKAELNREVPTNLDSVYQPDAAARIEESRNGMRKKILELMDRLASPQREEPQQQDTQYYRSLLERIVGDTAALDAAKEAICECDEDETRQAIISEATRDYESSKREIAKAILEKLT